MTAASHIKRKSLASASLAALPPASTCGDDPWEIPPFLRMSQAARSAAWARYKPSTVVLEAIAKGQPDPNARFKEIERAQAEARLTKRRKQTQNKAFAARADARNAALWRGRDGLSQANYTRIRNELYNLGGMNLLTIFDRKVTFDPSIKRWRFEGAQPRVPATQRTKTNGAAGKVSAASVDDVSIRLLAYDREQLLALAKANGVYDAKYENLPNPGLVRMTVGNRIRARAKRTPIQWV